MEGLCKTGKIKIRIQINLLPGILQKLPCPCYRRFKAPEYEMHLRLLRRLIFFQLFPGKRKVCCHFRLHPPQKHLRLLGGIQCCLIRNQLHHPLIQHVLQRIVNRRARNCDFFCQLIGRHGLRTDQCHINLCFQP